MKEFRVAFTVARVKSGFLLFDKIPCSLFGKSFASKVATRGVLERFLFGDGIPVFFAIDIAWPISFFSIDYRCEGL